MRKKRAFVSMAITMAIALLIANLWVSATPLIDSAALRDAVSVGGVRAHQAALQAIADANGGTRASQTPGYEASGVYVENLLGAAGYNVNRQDFSYEYFSSVFEQLSPHPTSYGYLVDHIEMFLSPVGSVTGWVQAVDLSLADPANSTSGCEASDFAEFASGNIALIQRGGCTFRLKADNAAAAGAIAAIIFNQGTPDRTGLSGGTLGSPGVTIPVISISDTLGAELNSLIPDLFVHLEVNSEIRHSFNVIAETPGGRTDRVVVVGAHLDSVPAGPGINDDGSGTATILEIALQMAALGVQPRNQVRFAFWGAEEDGLVGSAYYVSQLLSKAAIKDIAATLNFDMVGSPNFVRFVLDGDGSATPLAGPNGSKVIEDVFLDYFSSQGLATEPTPFDGRSDYAPFIAVGIPAGGLFTGAEGIKTAAQQEIYGGAAGVAYDPCYHQVCDTYDNNSNEALDQMSDAAAHAVLAFAMTTSTVNGTDKGSAWGRVKNLEYWGSRALR
jgi:Zn-dependent M28 family amino/carboxypeptidase